MAESHSLNIILTTILTIISSIIILLVTLYLIKYDAPPEQPSSIIVAPIEDEELYIDDAGDNKSSDTVNVKVTHTESFNMRPLSTNLRTPNLSNVRSSWIEICNPKSAPKSNNLKGLPISPRPPSFYPQNLNLNLSGSPGLPTSVRPLAVSPVIEEESMTSQRNSGYLHVSEDDDFAKKIMDRRSKLMSYTQQQPSNRMSFVAGDDSKLAL